MKDLQTLSKLAESLYLETDYTVDVAIDPQVCKEFTRWRQSDASHCEHPALAMLDRLPKTSPECEAVGTLWLRSAKNTSRLSGAPTVP